MVRLTDRPDMTLDVYRGRKTTIQQRAGSILYAFRSLVFRVIQLDVTEILVKGL